MPDGAGLGALDGGHEQLGQVVHVDGRPADALLAEVLGHPWVRARSTRMAGMPPPRPYTMPGRTTTARTPSATSASARCSTCGR
ncbi:hypothetical protein O1L60_34650 [Streptomyces diastatochromogenes]|nr:hypothetical protein [Streptomyces diastatochromogenes]